MIRGEIQICSVAFHPERCTLPQYISHTIAGDRGRALVAMHAGLLLLQTRFSESPQLLISGVGNRREEVGNRQTFLL